MHLLAGRVGQAHPLKRPLHARAAGGGRRIPIGGVQPVQVRRAGQKRVKAWSLDERPHPRQHVVQVARHVLAEQAHLPARGRGQTEQHSDGGCLPGAVRAQKSEHRTARHGQIDAVNDRLAAEPFGQPARLDRQFDGRVPTAQLPVAAACSRSSETDPANTRPSLVSRTFTSAVCNSRPPATELVALANKGELVTFVETAPAGS